MLNIGLKKEHGNHWKYIKCDNGLKCWIRINSPEVEQSGLA